MSKPQMNPPAIDIEQGSKDAYVDDSVGNNSGANICCCDTR